MNPTHSSLRLLVACVFTLASTSIASSHDPRRAEITYYVSTTGDDTWSGTLPSANADSSDGPFATLERARNEIRNLRKENELTEPVSVVMRQGKYFLGKTFVLHEADSGTQDCPITYRAYPGEKVIISGGKKVSGWTPYQRSKVYQCDFPLSQAGEWFYRQLFFNGKRQIRARYPNVDPEDREGGDYLLMEGPDPENRFLAFKYKEESFPRKWANPTEAEVNYFSGWNCWFSTVRIKDMDETNRIITLIHKGYQFDVAPWYMDSPHKPDMRFYVENLLEELDQPGEWCYDSQDEKIYFWPPDGTLDQHDEIVAPTLDFLIKMDNVSWVNIQNLTFTETINGDNVHPQDVDGAGPYFARVGWKYCGDALRMKNCSRCRIENNHFDQVGGNAVYVYRASKHNLIANNKIDHAGANGICVVGMTMREPVSNRITDNSITYSGVFNKYTSGILCGTGNMNVIAHNLVEHVPHYAINLSSNAGGRIIVEYNLIRNSAEVLRGDGGAINSWMELTSPEAERCGHIFRFNYVSDLPSSHTHGIYLDDFSSNCMITNNIFAGIGGAGILVHAGKNNMIENNIFENCGGVAMRRGVEMWDFFYKFTRLGFFKGNYVARNIFYRNSAGRRVVGMFEPQVEDTSLAYSDKNLFYKRGKSLKDKWTQWNRKGFDQNSIVADPLFVAPQDGDYRLQPNSPALKLGFQPIDISKIGPRSQKLATGE